MASDAKARDLDVVVIGAAGVDTNVFLYQADVDFTVEANFAENIDYVGGAGGYSSRGFARLGKRTAYIGYIGDDPNGRFVTQALNESGIETLLMLDPKGTRRSVNFMYRDGRRKNFYDAKGSMQLQPDLAACTALLGRARIAHFSIENWARYLLAPAREQGLLISCDLQDIPSPGDPYRQDFVDQADILFFSAANVADPKELMHGFLRQKPELVLVCGLGSKGAAIGTREGIFTADAVDIEDIVRDTNGAGDALAVGFLTSYYLDGYNLRESLLRGQIAARYTCTLRANSTDLITPAQLDAYFADLRGKHAP